VPTPISSAKISAGNCPRASRSRSSVQKSATLSSIDCGLLASEVSPGTASDPRPDADCHSFNRCQNSRLNCQMTLSRSGLNS